MGKKSKFKKLRKLANQLPPIDITVIKGEKVSGKELKRQGVDQVEMKPVDVNASYRRKQVVSQPLNHNRKLKQLYQKYGVKGVEIYIQAVNRYISSQQAKVANENPNQ